jgi:hypothetical protein
LNIISLGSSHALSSRQWRLTFLGLSRELVLNLKTSEATFAISSLEIDRHFEWIIRDSLSPLEVVFDLGRVTNNEWFAFDLVAEGASVIEWKLEALNADDVWSAGSLEVRSGDQGSLLEFKFEENQWYLTAQAPIGSGRSTGLNHSQTSTRPRNVKLLVDASPSAYSKLMAPKVIELLAELSNFVNRETGAALVVSYLGQFDIEISRDQQLESQHRNSIEKVLQQDNRPDPLRKIVLNAVKEAARGSRIVVLTDGSFLVSAELAELAEVKDVKVDVLIVGNPAVIAEMRESSHIKYGLLLDTDTKDRLEEISSLGLD